MCRPYNDVFFVSENNPSKEKNMFQSSTSRQVTGRKIDLVSTLWLKIRLFSALFKIIIGKTKKIISKNENVTKILQFSKKGIFFFLLYFKKIK